MRPLHGYLYRRVSKVTDDIHRNVNKTYTDVSNPGKIMVLALVGLLATTAVPTVAKEREPEPVEKPGECPIDAPLRVANIDSLRHFEGLIGHCPDAMVIESPAFRANRARTNARIPGEQRGPALDLVEPVAPTSGHFIIAGSQPASKSASAQAKSQDAMVEYVAIVPPSGAFAPTGALSDAATLGFEEEGAQPDVEAILALRPQSYATSFDEKIAAAARAHRVDPLLLHAVIKQESGYRQRAVSHAGARGLMQVMPATGRSLGVADPQHLFDAEVNISAGAKLLSTLWRRFDGNVDLVLAAYNAGEGAVIKYGMKVPPFRETREYVAKVKDNYRSLASESGIAVQF
jgi:hypothetical protein